MGRAALSPSGRRKAAMNCLRYGLLGFLLALSPAAFASNLVPLEPGQHYQGGTTLEIPTVGLSLSVPDGWVAILPRGGTMLVMTPDDISYVLALAEPATLEEARTFLAGPLPLGDGITLRPRAVPSVEAGDLVIDYDVTGSGQPYEGRGRARQMANDVVVAVFSLANPGGLAAIERVADQVLAGTTVLSGSSQPAQGGGANSSADDWHSYLMGRHLVRYYTGSGYNEEQHIYLAG